MTNCPSTTELSDYSLGKLGERAIWAISSHLNDCDRCRRAIESFDAASDHLLAAVRGRPIEFRHTADSETHELNELAARAERLGAIGLGALSRQPPFEALDVPSAESPSLLDREDTETSGSPAAGELAAPRRLGQYLLLEKIGQGAMGAVFRARHQRLKRIVAVKILPAARVHDERAIARFRREMEAVGQLDHAHIVRATDAGEADGLHFLVMEFVDGLDLHRLAIACGRVPIPEACELIRQAAVGLAHAHDRGLVHRDIKPSNLILDSRGCVKVLDLGLALLAESYELEIAAASESLSLREDASGASGSTSPSQILGTREYMPPEQAINSRAVDARGDVYSLGCTLFRLLTGGVPFPREDYDSLLAHLRAAAQQPAPSLHLGRPDAPPMLAAIVAKMLAKRPEDRFASAAEAARALAPYCVGADLPWLIAAAKYDFTPRDQRGGDRPTRAIVAELADRAFAMTPPSKSEVFLAELSDGDRPFKPEPVAQSRSWWIGAAALAAGALVLGTIVGAPLVYFAFHRSGASSTDKLESQSVARSKPETASTIVEPAAEEWCLRFGGAARVEIENSDAFLDPRKQPFTAEFMFRARGVGAPGFGGAEVMGFHPDPVDETSRRRTIAGHDFGPPIGLPRGMGGPFGDRAGWRLLMITPIGPTRDAMHFEFRDSSRFGRFGPPSMSHDAAPAHPGWHHVALCVSGGEALLARDGSITRQHLMPSGASLWEQAPTTGKLFIGSMGGDPFTTGASGDICAFRLSKGIRYNQNFPPLTELDRDDKTVCLLDFSAGEGERLEDLSGHGRHGKIVGAQWVRVDPGE